MHIGKIGKLEAISRFNFKDIHIFLHLTLLFAVRYLEIHRKSKRCDTMVFFSSE